MTSLAPCWQTFVEVWFGVILLKKCRPILTVEVQQGKLTKWMQQHIWPMPQTSAEPGKLHGKPSFSISRQKVEDSTQSRNQINHAKDSSRELPHPQVGLAYPRSQRELLPEE